VGADLSQRLVPDGLWEQVAPWLPSFGTSPATAHRRFAAWTPVDRGKKGSEPHVLSDAQGIPSAVAVSGANLHDSQVFKPLILAIPDIRSRRGPRRRRPVEIRAGKAYFAADHLARSADAT